ncbi:esterase/lipase family protein [Alkalimarinus alittae]|uniref:DUF676 domain-containing protein n=1 Tax=Alkalimarinus alittae TaxID=2961619 RepID=A0ABY6N2R6_9ALTE|nr:hypothetical protein [Alkalimarinus alittae]UZE96339.1 hypothetical protein NKI27_00925 [Alkalimarinus alittae]
MSDAEYKAKKGSSNVDYRYWGNVSRAVLNGVVGDYLVSQNNPLAIDMGFYHQGKPLSLPNPDMTVTNKVAVLLHGLTNLETIWDIDTGLNADSGIDVEGGEARSKIANYGAYLQRDFGYTPLFLRYNTGLSIEENGRQFTQLMDALITAYPKPIDEIIFVGFSLGGLLMRYAQKNAIAAKALWLEKLTQCFYLGTPHEGSYFERFGHLASSVVRSVPKEYINHWADWIDVRSEGIQDLKHGLAHLRNVESEKDDAHGSCGSFYQHARHHFISGSLSGESNSVLNKLFGDALVSKNSANPNSAPEGSQFTHFEGIPHIPLAHTETVYQQIKQWIEEAATTTQLMTYHPLEIDYTVPPKVMQLSHVDGNLSGLNTEQREMVAGAFDLMAVGYEKTVEAVEKVHLSIAKEPHAVLSRIPVVNSVSTIVERSQVGITEGVYESVKLGGILFRTASKLLKI